MGDATEFDTLVKAGLQDAVTVIITTHDDETNLFLTIARLRQSPSPNSPGAASNTLICKWPATLPAGKTIDTLVSSLDILPTFVAAAGGEIDKRESPGFLADAVLCCELCNEKRRNLLLRNLLLRN